MNTKKPNTIKTSWDLTLLYKGENDPQIQKDLQDIEKKCKAFEKKYKNANYTKSPNTLAQALKDYNLLQATIGGNKPWWYFTLKGDLNSSDSKAIAYKTKFEQTITKATNKISFFLLGIAKISKEKQKVFLKALVLKPYFYTLTQIFNNAQYNLSESEEQMISLLSQTSYEMWVSGQNKLLNKQTVQYKGKIVPISEARAELSDLPKVDRRKLHNDINNSLKSIGHFAEAELNAVFSYKKILDERRGFKKPYSATILNYENDEKAIENFVSLVTRYFKVSRHFYNLHSRLLGEKKITLADISTKIGKIKKKFDFKTTAEIVNKALGSVDTKYADFLDDFLKRGQIDVYPKIGKKGGAYCWGVENLPTFLLLNHGETIRSVETLGHEMGHAIHTELSKTQPIHYRHYTTATAEVASTFFEQVTGYELEKSLSDDEKIILLHNRLSNDMATIFRQVACFNFETELHTRIRTEGEVSAEEIAKLMAKHLKSYTGNSVDVTIEDGYTFVSWAHLRYFFYVYSYAYGQLISRALFEKWKEDKSYAKKIEQFLTAGRSMSPEDIFKSIGIDTSDPDFFESGLKSIENDIKKLEALTLKVKFKS